MNWESIVSGAISGGVFGSLAGLAAPWVTWSVEKQKAKQDSRRELLKALRSELVADADRNTFKRSANYFRISHLLSSPTYKIVDAPSNHEHGSWSYEPISPWIAAVLVDLTRIEREWNLI